MSDFAFAPYVCPGDTTSVEDGFFTFTARIVYDVDTRPEEFECYNKEQVAAWHADDWFYCGIVISAEYNGVTLPDSHLTSLWGIEANFPGGDNRYLTDIVRELLSEAKSEALKQLENLREALSA